MQNSYSVGQIVTFNDNKKGKVIQVLTSGNGDIREPYNRKGQPVIKGIDFIGHLTIIPNDWKVLYGDEIKESEVINIK